MATIPENIKAVFDSTFVKIDTIEELQKLVDTSETQLFKSDNTPITITKETRVDTIKTGMYGFRKEEDVEKNAYKVSTEPLNKSFSIKSLLRYGVFRKPILTVLAAAPTEYPEAANSVSLHLGTSEVDAMKEQGIVLEDNVLKGLADLRNAKTIYLYAKDVKKNTYSKISISKDPNTPTTIYLNPMTPTTRSEEEKKLKAKINGEILSLTAEIDSIQTETDESLKTCAKLSSEGTITGVTTSTLMKNKEKVLEKLTKEKTKLESNLANPAYITSAVKYGEPITLEKLQKKYILIISTEPWVTSTEQDSPVAAPVATISEESDTIPEESDTRSEQIVSEQGVPKQIVLEQGVPDAKSSEEAPKTSSFLGLFGTGGRRKTKKTNKKSRKGKSKKQNKSRKLFRTFYN